MHKWRTLDLMLSPDLQEATRITPVFAALGDVTRLQLVHRLSAGKPRSIRQLAEGLDLTHQGVTKHLKVLEGAGLIRGDKVGREKLFTCEPAVLHEATSYLDDIAKQWDQALLRLQAFVEDDQG